MRLPPLLLMLALAALPARADGPWTVTDLGHFWREAHCMEAAERTLLRLRPALSIRSIRRGAWMLFADGIGREGHHDAIIACSYGERNGARATLVIHSGADPVQAAGFARILTAEFLVLRTQITEAWKQPMP